METQRNGPLDSFFGLFQKKVKIYMYACLKLDCTTGGGTVASLTFLCGLLRSFMGVGEMACEERLLYQISRQKLLQTESTILFSGGGWVCFLYVYIYIYIF